MSDASPYRTTQLNPALPARPEHVRVLITGALFCDRCHSSLSVREIAEHRHLPERPDGTVPLPFDESETTP